MNYILFYSGKLPSYINYSIDSIIKTENNNSKIFLISDQKLFRKDINLLQIKDLKNDLFEEIKKINYFKKENDPLWEKSLERIFYLNEAAKQLRINNFIHFDCDVLIYKSFENLKNLFSTNKVNITPLNELFLNFSYCFVDGLNNFNKICEDILKTLENSSYFENRYYSGNRLNEMLLMNIAYINSPNSFRLLKIVPPNSDYILFDPGSYGQYLGGVDRKIFSKKTINFDHYVGRDILKKGLKVSFKNGTPKVMYKKNEYYLANLHIHKKNLGDFIK